MNAKLNPNRSVGEHAYALLFVLIVTGVSLALFASMASWTTTSTILNSRNNTYVSTVAAAEGASENVLGYIGRDFANQSFNPASLDSYRLLVPTNDWSAQYQFSDGSGNVGRTYVNSSQTMIVTNLDSQFSGLYGLAYTLAVKAQASPLNTGYAMSAAVEQDLQLASIPVFQFMVFYGMDLEINPGAPMKITGKVFSNGNIYTAPPSTLEYCDDVMAVLRIYNNRASCDPTSQGKTTPIYDAQHVEYVSSLTLPIGTNNSPDAVRAILEVPSGYESAQSLMGQQRYYNKADLVVTTTATNVQVKAGSWNSWTSVATNSTSGSRYSFVKTNASFYDQREGKYTLVTDLDVGAFSTWITNRGSNLNYSARTLLGHWLNTIYIQDLRQVSSKLTVVRVSNGKQLPPSGLTVATSRPLYTWGHYNAPITTAGSTNTINALPASLLGDAITILSGNWTDANSSSSLSSRTACDTTVNAAFLSGIVPTTCAGGGHYSGGLENCPRFLEDWGGDTFTYNGSIVVMFPSKEATNYWINTGTYYQAPTRKWAFDNNFRDYARLPPATPQVRKLVRSQWKTVAAR